MTKRFEWHYEFGDKVVYDHATGSTYRADAMVGLKTILGPELYKALRAEISKEYHKVHGAEMYQKRKELERRLDYIPEVIEISRSVDTYKMWDASWEETREYEEDYF